MSSSESRKEKDRFSSWHRFVVRVALVLFALTVWPATSSAFVGPMLGVDVQTAVDAGDFDEAESLLMQALAENEDPAVRRDLLETLGSVLNQAGRDADAAEAYATLANEIADESGPRDPERLPILDSAAAAYERAGDLESAVEALRQMLDIFVAEGGEPVDGAQPDGGGPKERAQPILDRLRRIAGQSGDDLAAVIDDVIAQFENDVSRASLGEGFTVLRIYYGTDRARSGSKYPSKFYSGERGDLELGTALVSIPDSHKPGQLEKPNIWTLDVRLDPERHIVLKEVTPAPADDVFSMMRQHVENTGSPEAFVFVHGFNVSFADAARRTAQMAYDMNFRGLPILFSWPSRDSVLSYISDTAVVNLSGRRLSLFLEDVVAKSGATRIHLIAHSMGNRALTDALELYALRNAGKPAAFDQILFAAPDLDAGLFAAMARTIRPIAKRLTLYASNNDWALAVSRRLHGDSQRAGQGGDGILISPLFDTVDMSDTENPDLLDHSYFVNNPAALIDIFSLFWRDAPPNQRCGMTQKDNAGGDHYWFFTPGECGEADTLLSTLAILKRGSVHSIAEARAFFNRYIRSPSFDRDERNKLIDALGRLLGS